VTGYDDIEYASLTDVGVRRSHNQDAYAALPAGDLEQWQGRGHVFLVADGMGAHAVGELASKLAADSIPHIYTKHAHEGPVSALRKAFIETNLSIHTRGQQNREFEGMGTTATAILLRPEGAWVGHVGDSRAYRIRDGKIEQLSFDHSLVWELARRQHKNPDELQGIPSNVIVRSLGPEPLVQVDVEGPHPVRAGDTFVLCSDGLSGPVTDREIGAVVSALPPADACRFLINLANLQGGPDNITAVVVRVGRPVSLSPRSGEPREGMSPNGKADDSAVIPGTKDLGHTLSRTLKRGWPILALLLGIFLAFAAIALLYNEISGGAPIFVLAAIALAAGLFGLVVQIRREKHEDGLGDADGAHLKVYRQTPCVIDGAFVQRLNQAVADLEQRVRDKNWQFDWDTCKGQRDLSDQHFRRGELVEAFRANCQAMLLLMEAVQLQRGKGEEFRPLW
jgi:protein phosphatase